jgi:uncharacterized protein (DUF488 family)
MKPKAIWTIGYEGASIGAFIDTLRHAGVELVLDIGAAPVSRKKGFSKNQLAAHLASAGLGYRYLRGLGTPKRARDPARSGDLSPSSMFRAHMDEPQALVDLGAAEKLAKEWPICLLCLERDPLHCHRLIGAEHMATKPGQTIEPLFVKPNYPSK